VNPYRFVGALGYYYDSALTQYYVRARHFDPLVARWLSFDLLAVVEDVASFMPLAKRDRRAQSALRPVAAQATSRNPYAYCVLNPTIVVDPDGLYPVCCSFMSSSGIWSETYDCRRYYDLPGSESAAKCCKYRGSGWFSSWTVLGSYMGKCNSPPPRPPKDKCAGDWTELDFLNCLECCTKEYNWTWTCTTSATLDCANAAGNAAFGRYPRASCCGPKGSPSTWQHKVCMGTKFDKLGRFAGRVCVYATIAEGALDIGIECACSAICSGIY